jgi:aryl-alcohol dehydrogenase-like predicted oxidoreductase
MAPTPKRSCSASGLKTLEEEMRFLATKFANSVKDGQMIARGDAVYVNQACPASLERLGVYCLDLYY